MFRGLWVPNINHSGAKPKVLAASRWWVPQYKWKSHFKIWKKILGQIKKTKFCHLRLCKIFYSKICSNRCCWYSRQFNNNFAFYEWQFLQTEFLKYKNGAATNIESWNCKETPESVMVFKFVNKCATLGKSY